MRGFIIGRLIQVIISLFVVATVIFFMFRLLPGDPTTVIIEPGWSMEAKQMLIERFGLDRPLHEQYILYLRNILQGDLGYSFFYNVPVVTILADKFWNTLVLIISAMLVSYGIGIAGGVLLAWYRGTTFEALSIVSALVFRAFPPFFVGMLFIMLFSFQLGWFPHSGMRTAGFVADTFAERYFNLDFLRHLIMPMTVSALYFLARPLLIMRSSMLEIMGEDYIDMAHAKGLSNSTIMFKHVARNAMLPVVTQIAIFLGIAVGGQVLIEYVFGWPGLGREIVLAAQRHDYPLAQASFLLMAAMIMLMNFLADLVYGYLDPRVSYK